MLLHHVDGVYIMSLWLGRMNVKEISKMKSLKVLNVELKNIFI